MRKWLEHRLGRVAARGVKAVLAIAAAVATLYGAWEVYRAVFVSAGLDVDIVEQRPLKGRPVLTPAAGGRVFAEGATVRLWMRHDGGSGRELEIAEVALEASYHPGAVDALRYTIEGAEVDRPLGGQQEDIPSYLVILEGHEARAEKIEGSGERRPVPVGNLLETAPVPQRITLGPNDTFTLLLGLEALETGLYSVLARVRTTGSEDAILVGPIEIYYED